MKAVILAGGLGTRLGKLTQKTPKPLIHIGNKPVVKHIIDRLKQHHIEQVLVKTHYLPEQILYELGDEVLYFYEPVLFSAEETLQHLQGWLDGEDFLVANGDTLSEIDYTEMLAQHKQGTISVAMDDWRCVGTWIYPANYFIDKQIPVYPYRPAKLDWYDIGTPERLEAAIAHYMLGEKNVCP